MRITVMELAGTALVADGSCPATGPARRREGSGEITEQRHAVLVYRSDGEQRSGVAASA